MSKKIKILPFFIIFTTFLLAQKVTLKGNVVAAEDLENIHVLNKTSFTNATTDSLGLFKISAKLNDTIVFSSVQYQILVKVVTQENIEKKSITVNLDVYTNALDEVFLTKPLSGNLNDDVSTSKAKATLNFYDVGIPGYTGKPLTQNENRLNEAGGNEKTIAIGLGAAVNFNKLLNQITGRTKRLKERVRLESNDVLLARIKSELSESFFKTHPLPILKREEFFYFCQEDSAFLQQCSKSNLQALQFLSDKYYQYLSNIEVTKQD